MGMLLNNLCRSFEILFSYIVNSASIFGFEKCSSSLHAENIFYFFNLIFFLQSAVFNAPIETDFSFVLLLEQMHCIITFKNIFAKEHEQQRGTKIIDPLDVSASWVTNRPNEENTCHHALHLLAFE